MKTVPQVSQPTHGILRKLLHDLDLSRRAGLKVSHRIPLRFLQANLAHYLTHTALPRHRSEQRLSTAKLGVGNIPVWGCGSEFVYDFGEMVHSR